MRFLFIGSLGLAVPLLAQQPIGHTSATEVQVSGAVNISHGQTTLGNGSEITAGNQAVKIILERGGRTSCFFIFRTTLRQATGPSNIELPQPT